MWLDWELFAAPTHGELGGNVPDGEEEYGEKNDFGSVVVLGVSSESESAGVMVGGTDGGVKFVTKGEI
jgi:hypothetical protein